jgi:hypothetical protein
MIRVFLFAFLILMTSTAYGSDYSFGTKVMSTDLDIGRPLFCTPAGTTVGFWDVGTPGYDEGDPVYLHIARFCAGLIGANDIRLTGIDNHSPGSKVTFSDVDMNRPLTLLPSTINFLNIHGSQAYDLEDPVYLHQYYCEPNYMTTAMAVQNQESSQNGYALFVSGYGTAGGYGRARSPDFKEQIPYRGGLSVPRTSCIEFTDGYKMLVTDYVVGGIPQVAGIWRGLVVEVIHGVKADYYHVLNTWYVKIDSVRTNGPCLFAEGETDRGGATSSQALFIRTNDVRLNATPSMQPGTKVVNFDPDQNKMLEAPAFARFLPGGSDAARIKFFDVNGNSIYDYPDDVYLNYPSGTANGIVTVNNVRLSGPVNASPV